MNKILVITKRYKGCFGFIIGLFLLLMIQSCIKDVLDMKQARDSKKVLDNSIVTPLAYGTISIQNIINKFDKSSVIGQDNQGLLYLSYSGNVLSYRADSVINIPFQNHQEFFLKADTDFGNFLPGQKMLSFTRTISDPFNFTNGEQLDSIWIKQGTLTYGFSWSFTDTGNFVITFPTVKKNGIPLSKTYHVNTMTGNTNVIESADISGYHIVFSGSSPGKSYFDIKYTITLYNTGDVFAPGEQIAMTSDFSDLKFKALFGYIGNYTLIKNKDTINVGIFDNSIGGNIVFADPQINLTINNSFGVPVQLGIVANSYSKKNNDSMALSFSPTVIPINIKYPSLIQNQFGQTKQTLIKIDKTTSNIDLVMASMPNKMTYSVSGISNPGGSTPDNYILDTSRFSLDFAAVLPFNFKASGFSLTDSSSFSVDSALNSKLNLDTVTAHLVTDNSIPFALNAQVYFLNNINQRVDSMFKYTKIIDPAVTDGNGNVTSAVHTDLLEPLTKKQISNILKNSKKIVFSISFSTPNAGQTFAKFYSSNSLNFHFGIMAHGTYLINKK